MKKRELKKQLALMLCLVMMLSVLNPFVVLAEEAHVFEDLDLEEESVTESVYGIESEATHTINIHLSIEGIESSILAETLVQISYDENQPTALDALEQALEVANIPYELVDYGWSIMVVSIGEDAAGTFGGYDGWMYLVNDVSPDVGASAYKVSDGDDVFFYYNRWPALSSGTQIKIDETDPKINLNLVGDEFTASATDPDNWIIDLGKTELILDELTIHQHKPSDTQAAEAIITLNGTAQSGIITIEVKAEALGGGNNSNVVQLFIEQQIDIPLTDHDWVKNGQSVLDALLKYQQADGSFWWTQEADGGLKWPTADVLDALVNLSLGGSAIHLSGKEISLDVTNQQLNFAVNNSISWYQQNYPAPDHWRGISALRNFGQNLNEAPWAMTQTWRNSDPGFTADATGNEHVHHIFKLLAVGLDPEEAWDDRNLFHELAAQQNDNTGSFGDLGKHIWATVALDTGKNLGKDIPNWNDQSQKAALLHLIKQQNTDGSFGIFSELDFTGWALVALSNYRGVTIENHSIDNVIDKALTFLNSRQKENAGFDMEGEWGEENASSNAAVVAGLAAVGETLLPQENVIEIKDNKTPLNISLEKGAAPTRIIATISEENGTKKVALPPIRVEADSPQGTIQLDFLSGTQVTGSGDWDGGLLLPRWLDPSSLLIKDSDIHFVIETGVTGGSLSFDRPARLLIPGQKGKSAGFVQQGILTEIENELWGDGEDSLYGADIGKINVGDDLVIWTTHFTTFVSYDKTETTPPSGGGGGGGTPGSDIRASLAVRGYQGQTILPTTEAIIDSSETVLTFTQKVLDQQGISHDISGGYVRAINGLAELDHGPESGWMFSINGTYPQIAASSTSVRSNDRVEWRYTLDLGEDLGAGPGASLSPTVSQTVTQSDLKESQEKAITWILNNRDFSSYDNFTDWDALVLARYGEKVPEAYWVALEKVLSENEGSFRLVTDYARIILAATALGQHGENIAGFNLLEKMMQHENMLLQGVNGPAHVLLALDAYAYEEPADAIWNREKLIGEILRLQKWHGGYSLSERADAPGDIDLTAMVLQALAPYRQQEQVKKVTDKAVIWLLQQNFNNSESISQSILAFSSLGLDAVDQTFEQVEGNLLQELMEYQQQDGGFAHRQDVTSSDIATQQAVMAMTAYQRYQDKANTFFDMRDVMIDDSQINGEMTDAAALLASRLEQIHLADEIHISAWALEWVKKAVAYGLMSGVSAEELRFDPKRELTRAEFAVLMAKLHEADMSLDETAVFQDVQPGSWYFGHVMTARKNGWMSGVAEDTFAPHRSISRQEMAVVLAKALELTAANKPAQPADLDEAAEWAKGPVGLVYQHRLMVGDGQRFMPTSVVTREMAAVIMVKLYEDHLKQ